MINCRGEGPLFRCGDILPFVVVCLRIQVDITSEHENSAQSSCGSHPTSWAVQSISGSDMKAKCGVPAAQMKEVTMKIFLEQCPCRALT